MALKKFSGAQLILLSTGANDNPTMSAGAETAWKMGGMDVVVDGKALYTPGVLLSLTVALTQSGGTGTRLSILDIYRALISSVEVRNSFFGVPVRASKVIGSVLPSLEFITGGYGFWAPKRTFVPAANGTYNLVVDVFLPINYFGCNADDEDTMQLVAAYTDATLAVTMAPAATLTAMSTGASFGAVTAKASMIVVPDREIRLAPGIEAAVYLAPFASGSQIDFTAMGDDTGFNGVESGAGMLYMGLLTSARGQLGPFAGNQITAFGFPARSQRRTTHLEPVLAAAWAACDPNGLLGSVQDAATSQGLSDFSRYPHLYTTGADPTGSSVNSNLVAFPVVTPGKNLRLSNVQRFSGNMSVLAEFSGGSGTHQLFCVQAKRWLDATINAYTARLLTLGVPQKVMQTDRVRWEPKINAPKRRSNNPSSPDYNRLTATPKTARYLPWSLKAA